MKKTLIERVEVDTAGQTITFSSIPSDYTDLLVVASIRMVTGNDAFFKFNNSTSNYTSKHLNGTGSGVSSFSRTDTFAGWWNASGYTGSTFGSWAMYVPNYTLSNYKRWSIDSVTENNATASQQFLTGGLWSDTSAITQIDLYGGSGFVVASSAALYGITAGSD